MMKWINDWNKWIIALLLLVAGMKVEGQSAKGDSVAVWEKALALPTLSTSMFQGGDTLLRAERDARFGRAVDRTPDCFQHIGLDHRRILVEGHGQPHAEGVGGGTDGIQL